MHCLDEAVGFPVPKGQPDKFQGEWWNLHYFICSQLMCILFSWQRRSWSLEGERHLLVCLRLALPFGLGGTLKGREGPSHSWQQQSMENCRRKKLHECGVGRAEVVTPSQHKAFRKWWMRNTKKSKEQAHSQGSARIGKLVYCECRGICAVCCSPRDPLNAADVKAKLKEGTCLVSTLWLERVWSNSLFCSASFKRDGKFSRFLCFSSCLRRTKF